MVSDAVCHDEESAGVKPDARKECGEEEAKDDLEEEDHGPRVSKE